MLALWSCHPRFFHPFSVLQKGFTQESIRWPITFPRCGSGVAAMVSLYISTGLLWLLNLRYQDQFMLCSSEDTNSTTCLSIWHTSQFHWHQWSYFWYQIPVPKCISAKLIFLSKYLYYIQKIRKLSLPGTLNIILMNAIINSTAIAKTNSMHKQLGLRPKPGPTFLKCNQRTKGKNFCFFTKPNTTVPLFTVAKSIITSPHHCCIL